MNSAATQSSRLVDQLQKSRRELLDLSARNRLISTPLGVSRSRRIDIIDEMTEEVFRILVRDRKAMSFLPGDEPEGSDATGEMPGPQLAQPEEVPSDSNSPAARHVDTRLQTRLLNERLQSRLLDMYFDAQTYEQEQGVSILYIAAGFLRWYESPTSEIARFAPLLLIPVDLERPTAASRFLVKAREEDIATNLSLQAKLIGEFGIRLPEIPDPEDLSPTAYFEDVQKAVSDRPRWEVLPNEMVLWFFSFAKFLMYRDLDPSNWPAHSPLESNPSLQSLLVDGFSSEPPICGEGEKIDPVIPPINMIHVTDADSSQAVVIEEVRRGRHLSRLAEVF